MAGDDSVYLLLVGMLVTPSPVILLLATRCLAPIMIRDLLLLQKSLGLPAAPLGTIGFGLEGSRIAAVDDDADTLEIWQIPIF